LGLNRRLVLLLAWETLFPELGRDPVSAHTFAIVLSSQLPPATAFCRGEKPLILTNYSAKASKMFVSCSGITSKLAESHPGIA
jgi:hypothetical protein